MARASSGTRVGQGEASPVEEERVEVLLRDDGAGVVRHAAEVREHAGGLDLAREREEVSVVDRELGGAVNVRHVRQLGPRVPGEDPAAREVEAVEERGAVRLVHERDVGLVEQVFEEDRLPEIREDTTHPRDLTRRPRGWKPK